MISLHATMSASDKHPPPDAAEDGFSSFVLGIADYCGFQSDDNGGGFELWTLRKSLRGHPAGSTVTRQTLERAYRAGIYGAAHVTGKAKDFDAVESP